MLATIFMDMSLEDLQVAAGVLGGTILVIAILAFGMLAVLKAKSQSQPVITLKAKVIDKETSGINTLFTFECEDGERRKFSINNTILVVGDEGDLTYQGYFFKGFVKK